MSAPLPSDEVAEDYRNSLEDLISNDRYQISNLTLIAKENVEHAEAISRVLQNHISRAPPGRKLPALYVLDSVVKNVGSPYNVYFGRNLYQTFMGAYSQVDHAVRRKLEEMLKTWREPVPGSLTTTPVFPLSSTQNIVDTLNKLRAATAPPPQRYQPSPLPPQLHTTPMQAYRDTPTPPQTIPSRPPTAHTLPPTPAPNTTSYSQPQHHAYGQLYQQYQFPQYQQPQPPTLQYLPPQTQVSNVPNHGVDLAKLHADIDDLTTDAKIDCATHPMDQAAQKKLTTLQTLKEILEAGTSTASEIVEIRNSISQQMTRKVADRSPSAQIPSMPMRNPYAPPPPPPQYPQQYPQYPPPSLPYQNSQPPQRAPTPALPNLADLLRQHVGHTNIQPLPYGVPYSQPSPMMSNPPVDNATPAPAQATELPLIAALRAQGLLSAAPTPPQILAPPNGGYASFTPMPAEVTFASASMKIPGPHLVASFLNARPNQCSTCGRRFTSDDPGREKKARHLDWHFKTKTRMVEAEKRGQNRSWYVDEREWIASREYDDDAPEQNGNGVSPVQKQQQEDFVRAPSDPMLRSMPCPIDQEPFKSEWSEEVQDFIWKDAIQVGNRYYHASCYREVTKDRDKDAGGATPMGADIRTATPDSVLGKRKAEQEANGVKSRIKMDA